MQVCFVNAYGKRRMEAAAIADEPKTLRVIWLHLLVLKNYCSSLSLIVEGNISSTPTVGDSGMSQASAVHRTSL